MSTRHFSAHDQASFLCLVQAITNFYRNLLTVVSFEELLAAERNPITIGLRSVMTFLAQPKLAAELQRALAQGWTLHVYMGESNAIKHRKVPVVHVTVGELAFPNDHVRLSTASWVVLLVPPPNRGVSYTLTCNDSWFYGYIFRDACDHNTGWKWLTRLERDLQLATEIVEHWPNRPPCLIPSVPAEDPSPPVVREQHSVVQAAHPGPH